MATRHLIIVDSEGEFTELPQQDQVDLSNNIVDVGKLRLVDNNQVSYELPQQRGYFGQTLVTDSQGIVSWESIDSVQFSDSELLFAFNNSIAQLDHNYQASDSDVLVFVGSEILRVEESLSNESTLRVNADNELKQDVSGLQTSLNNEISARVANVQTLIGLIEQESTNRRDADTVIEQSVSSGFLNKSQVTNTIYVNSGAKNFANAVAEAGTQTARHIVLPPGSLNSGSSTTINNANILNITGPVAPSAAPAVEIIHNVLVTGSNSTRVRFTHVQFDGEFEINGTQGRHSFRGVVFEKVMRFSGTTTNFIIFENCSFDGGFVVPNTFGGVIYLIGCSFNNISPTLNQMFPQQVIMTQCSGLPTFPTNVFLGGQNSLASGFVRDQVSELFIGNKKINPNIDSDWIVRSVDKTFTQVSDEFIATESQSVFTLSNTPSGSVVVFRNGIRVPSSNITIVGNQIHYPTNGNFVTEEGDVMCFDYIKVM